MEARLFASCLCHGRRQVGERVLLWRNCRSEFRSQNSQVRSRSQKTEDRRQKSSEVRREDRKIEVRSQEDRRLEECQRFSRRIHSLTNIAFIVAELEDIFGEELLPGIPWQPSSSALDQEELSRESAESAAPCQSSVRGYVAVFSSHEKLER